MDKKANVVSVFKNALNVLDMDLFITNNAELFNMFIYRKKYVILTLA